MKIATSYGSPPPCTCHTDLSVDSKEQKRTYTKPEHRSFKEPRGGWEAKSSKATPSNPRGQNHVAMARMHMCNVITC